MAARLALAHREQLAGRQNGDIEDRFRIAGDVLRQNDVAADLAADLVDPRGERLVAGGGLLARDQLAQLALLALLVDLLFLERGLLPQLLLEGEVALGLGLRLGL